MSNSETWLSVTVPFPNLTEMSDEEIEAIFDDKDGRWSGLTKSLMAKHGAVGLDLNRNWATIPTYLWRCPGCYRDKVEAVRRAPNGILLARLELHHDHMREAIKDSFQAKFGQKWVENAPRESVHLYEELNRMVARFDDVLICIDCNAADGEVKRRLKAEIHQHFSFDPEEIRCFISAGPNRPHEIDLEKARELWLIAQSDFSLRLGFVENILDRMAQGEFRRKQYWTSREITDPVSQHRLHVYRSVLRAAGSDLSASAWLREGYEHLEARSISNDGAGRSLKTTRNRFHRVPTDYEISEFKPGASAAWNKVATDWRCPCCARLKERTLRFSKSHKLFGQIRSYCEYEPETDPTNLDWRLRLYPSTPRDIVFGNRIEVQLCADCADIPAELQRKCPTLKPVYLSIAEIRSCLESVSDHLSHEVEQSRLKQIATRNKNDLVKAIHAFEQHRELSTTAAGCFEILRARYGKPESLLLVKDRLSDRLISFDSDGEYEDMSLIQWLIAEGDRLCFGD